MILRESYSYGFLSLWVVFISYYGDVFNKLKKLINKGYNFIGLSTDLLLFKNQIDLVGLEIKKLNKK